MIRLTQYANSTVAVFGLARSGLSAVRALKAGGARVVAWDDEGAKRALLSEEDLQDPATLDWAKVAALVLSPGVPFTHPTPHPAVQAAQAAGVPIISDIELLGQAAPKATYIGITGTNGKSTTTALIGHILRSAGRRVQIGGNIGTPVLDLNLFDADGIYVLELSSYQLDITPTLVFDIAVLLNITPDHIDRHGDMAGYVAAKRRVFAGQKAGSVAVIGVDDPPTAAIAAELSHTSPAKIVPLSLRQHIPEGLTVDRGRLYEGQNHTPTFDLNNIAALPGAHNWQNAAAAVAIAKALGLESQEIWKGLVSFPGLVHRMELIGECNGVKFINDSKATNADAAARALACYDTIYWIAGGRAKDGGIDALKAWFPRIRRAFLIGEAAASFAETLTASGVKHEISGDLERAVKAAYQAASADNIPGAVVLLSPACASFDQFRDFEERGGAFRVSAQTIMAPAPRRAGGAW